MRLRVAFFSPLTPLHTALADHSEGLLPHLAKGADIDLFIDEGYRPSSPEVTGRFQIYSYRTFGRRAGEYDLPVYVMGNNHDFHGYMHDVMRDHPGVVLFHDTDFQHYFVARTLQRGDVAAYQAEMEYAYGQVGRQASAAALAGDVEKLRGVFSLVERLLDWNRGAVVYNEFAAEDLQQRRPGSRVRRLNYHFYLPRGFPTQVDVAGLRARWGLPESLLLGTFGLFIPDKRIEVCLRAFKRFLEQQPDARYLLVGNHPSTYDVAGMIRGHGLEDRVTLTGWMDALQFAQHLCVPDIAIHLRYPHIGGTLYTPIRLLGLGRPTILSDIAPLDGFPEGCCAKVSPTELEEETLLAILGRLAGDQALCRQMGDNARRFIGHHHNAATIARQHLEFFEEVVAAPPPPVPEAVPGYWQRQLLREAAGTLAKWGVSADDDELLAAIAAAVAGVTAGE